MKKVEKILEGLDKEQLMAVSADMDKNILCNSIAGSGKTQVLTRRVGYLIANGVKEHEIMLLTFTNKAAKEMTDRVSHLLGIGEIDIVSGTFHSVASTYLRKYSNYLGYSGNFTILDQEDSKKIINDIRGQILEDHKIAKKDFPSAGYIQAALSSMINKKKELEEYDNRLTIGELKIISSILVDYKNYKKKGNLLDFDDMLIDFKNLLKIEDVARSIRSNIKYVLIDEYQDVNHLQEDIIELVSGKNRVFAVGDPSQSIYGFRGSDISYILNFVDKYQAIEINLKRNYRSDKNVLRLAEISINNNPQKKYIEMVANKTTDYQQLTFENINTNQEISQLVGNIQKLLNNGVSPNEIAVLVRGRGMELNILEIELKRNGIDYDLRAGQSFLTSAHIKDVLALIEMLANPKSFIAMSRVLGMVDGIGFKKSNTVQTFIEKNRFDIKNVVKNIDSLKVSAKNRTDLKKLFNALIIADDIDDMEDKTNYLIDNIYMKYFEKKYRLDKKLEEKLEDVKGFPLIAKDFKSPIALLNDLVLDQTTDEDINEEDKIIVSTMHRAKGLEWDCVFIPFLNMGVFPKQIFAPDEQIEEERRLFYVALTRARKQLFLSYSRYSFDNDLLKPSLFYEEIINEISKIDI